MKRAYKSLLYLCLVQTAFTSCSKSNRDASTLEVLLSKSVVIPPQLSFRIMQDSIDINEIADAMDYTIICYVDSAECTPCKMQLGRWSETLDNFIGDSKQQIAFLMIVNSADDSLISQIAIDYDFRHPIALDKDASFIHLNNLPKQSKYHTLLTDAAGNIISVGNPATNPKIRALYKDLISSTEDQELTPAGIALCSKNTKAAGVVKSDSITEFFLVNHSDSAITIEELSPSCGCIIPKVQSMSILPDSTVRLSVLFNDKAANGYFDHSINIFYKEQETPESLRFYGIKQ